MVGEPEAFLCIMPQRTPFRREMLKAERKLKIETTVKANPEYPRYTLICNKVYVLRFPESCLERLERKAA